jgi:hypothetical protein
MPRSTNKSEAIRELLAQQPAASVREIVSTLGQKGIKVRPTLVYFIRSKQRQQTRRQKRQRAAENSARAGVADPVKLILAVKSLAQDAGGMRHLKQLVDALAE